MSDEPYESSNTTEMLFCERCQRVHSFGWDVMGYMVQLPSCRPRMEAEAEEGAPDGEEAEDAASLRARLAAAEEDRATLIQRMKSVYGALVDAQDISFSADTLGEAVRELSAKREAAEKENEALRAENDKLRSELSGMRAAYQAAIRLVTRPGKMGGHDDPDVPEEELDWLGG